MKKYLLIAALLIFASAASISYALDNETTINQTSNITVKTSVNITPIDNEIKMDEAAKFLVSISGDFDDIERFRIYSPAVEWDIPETVLKVYPVIDKANLTLEIRPLHVDLPGVYGIPITVKDMETDELFKKIVYISLRSGIASAGTVPSIGVDIGIPETVNPKEELNINLDFYNKNLLNLTNLRFEVSSSIEDISASQSLEDLSPLEKISLALPFELDPLEPAGENTFTVNIYQGEKLVKSESKKFNISRMTPPFAESSTVDSFLLRIKKVISYKSESNVPDAQTVKIETNWLEKLLTSTSTPADIVSEDGKVYYKFNLELAPQESETVTIVTNYRILAYIILILIVIVFFYVKNKSPLVIKKSLTQLGTGEEGVSEMKIMLEISNTSKKDIKNVTVRDPIPNLVDVKQEFAEGTLKPSKFLKSKDGGIVLEWKIDELAAGENRLIGYNVKARLNIVGSFKLPRTKIYYIKKGKEKVTYSNSVGVSG